MPKIKWLNLPTQLRRHLLERAKERNIRQWVVLGFCGAGNSARSRLSAGSAA
jgi:hypothetical protein